MPDYNTCPLSGLLYYCAHLIARPNVSRDFTPDIRSYIRNIQGILSLINLDFQYIYTLETNLV